MAKLQLLGTLVRLFVTLPFISPVLAQQSPARPPPAAMHSAQEYPQPTDQDRLRETAAGINNQRSVLFAKGDAAGIASMYLPTATYVELLPRLSMMTGRAQIEDHFKQLFSAHATELKSAVTSARMVDADTQIVGGEYFIVAKGKKTMGHFMQVLKRDGDAWRIMTHVFARPEPITVQEINEYRG